MEAHLLIGNPEHRYTSHGQYRIACLIVGDLKSMNTSIYLDDEPRRMAVKVHNEPVNDLLPMEVHAVQATRAEVVLEDALLVSHLLSQVA